jgi:hypothetical protein
MHDLTCSEARDSVAEYALDILDPVEKSSVAAHLIRCPDCRAEADSMQATAGRLLDLVPGTEPPLGFDRRVMERVGAPRPHHRRQWILGLSAAAAVLVIVGGVFAAVNLRPSHHPAAELAASFTESGHKVGVIDIYPGRTPPWVSMSVEGVSVRGSVSCVLVSPDGSTTKLGSFDLVNGSGSWGAPDRWSTQDVLGARLLDTSGQVVASATF